MFLHLIKVLVSNKLVLCALLNSLKECRDKKTVYINGK